MQQNFVYVVVAFAAAWVALLIYLAFVTMRIRNVRTELAAVEELVRDRRDESK
jgi:flagellar biosynthesis/type III secretory pathway M-ring protein FliF/YscJ